jgi:transcriptional regulator
VYIPAAFRETDPVVLFDFIEANSFALLASISEGAIVASHLPLLLDREPRPHGRLVGHMARANEQWRGTDGQEVLAVFSGPHAYVSPTWYESENVVPTWNYIAVHAYGTFRLIDKVHEIATIVQRYVEFYERTQPMPWRLPPHNYFLAKLLPQIVGFTIDVTRLEGKWKLSQNRPPHQQVNVSRALAQQTDPQARSIARWMEARRNPP